MVLNELQLEDMKLTNSALKDAHHQSEAKAQVTKPSWCIHTDHRVIYSLHIHPDGTRFATGGADMAVKIWNMDPVSNESSEEDESVPKLLATLTVHTGAVNAVRWHPDGSYLASAGDDRTVLLWQLSHDSKPITPFGVDAPPCVENYRCVANLLGHEAEVQDLAWSPCSNYLASCSVDNSIIIWNADTFQKVHVLEGHTAWVKGLAWDPLNKFLASQSTDGSLVLWRTSDWQIEKRITHPFLSQQYVSMQSYESDVNRQIVFYRLDWAPDGNVLVGTYAHRDVFVSPTFVRGTWNRTVSFVGHKKPTTVVRFCPTVFSKAEDPEDDDPEKHFCVLAIGSMDGNIVVWSSNLPKPVIVFKAFFEQSVLDLSWSSDGRVLMAASHDGTVAFFEFDARAFKGRPLVSKVEFSAIAQNNGDAFQSAGETLLESASALLLEKEMQKTSPSKGTSMVIEDGEGLGVDTVSLPKPVQSSVAQAQSVTTAPDGRRRIAPVLHTSSSGTGLVSSIAKVPRTPPQPAVDLMDSRLKGPGNAVPTPSFSQPRFATPQVSRRIEATSMRTLLEAASVRPRFTVTIDQSKSTERLGALGLPNAKQPPAMMEVVLQHSQGKPARSLLHVSRGDTTMWRSIIEGEVTVACGSHTLFAVATAQLCLYALSPSGRRLMPPVVCDSKPVDICIQQNFVQVLCTSGSLCVWDIDAMCVVYRCSVEPLFNVNPKHASLLSCRVDGEGRSFVTMAPHAHVYTYHTQLESWIRIADQDFIASEHFSTLHSSLGALEGIQAPTLAQAKVNEEELFYMSDEVRATTTLAHLEHQIAASIALDSAEEYRRWVLAYATQLVSYCGGALQFPESRLKELCLDLAGQRQVAEDDDSICGVSKRSLFREVIPLLASNRSLQKLTALLLEISKSLNQ